MKIVLFYLLAFCLLVRTNFTSKPGAGGRLIETNSGKFFALFSKKQNSKEVRSNTRKKNERTVNGNNRYGVPEPQGNFVFSGTEQITFQRTRPLSANVQMCSTLWSMTSGWHKLWQAGKQLARIISIFEDFLPRTED